MGLHRIALGKLCQVLLFAALLQIVSSESWASSLRLSWSDNSANESGFKIERKTGGDGVFAVIANVAADTTAYTDNELVDGTTYCYRLFAFSASEDSSYSNESCAVAPSASSVQTVINTVTNAIAMNIAAGAVLSGPSVPWEATPSGVPDSVQFWIDGALRWTEFFSPYQFNGTPSGRLDTTTLSDGSHELKVRALYADNSVAEAGITVTVANRANNTTSAEKVVTLTVSNRSMATRIGIFRPTSGEWFLDLDGNGRFDGCNIDACITGYGNNASLPIVGDWFGTAKSYIGVFDSNTRAWHLDDGDGQWGECGSSGDICVDDMEGWGTNPVVKDLGSANRIVIGIFQPQSTTQNTNSWRYGKLGVWKFDTNGNGLPEACPIDECITNFGTLGDLPVTGDWSGSGDDAIGFFRPQSGEWYLDFNGNGSWDGSGADRLLGRFGGASDLPLVGDWDGSGTIRIGIFRPSTGEWFLDINGNGQLDSCEIDACLGPFGQAGDLPVAGKW
jgi:hypothetical protein